MADVRCQTATVSELEDGQKLGTVVLSETAKPEAKLVELVRFDEKGFPIFKMDVLETILDRGGAKNLPTIAISICGAHNSGKSFLLHVLIMYFRYLEHSESCNKWTEGQMKEGHWICGKKTEGIWIWDTPIVISLKQQKVAVILLDCQGSGDSASQNVEMLTTYMSMRISNVQLYNVKPDWSISHLRMVELLVDALASSQHLALESLVWLVRDWVDDCEYVERPNLLVNKLKEIEAEAGALFSFNNKPGFTLPNPGDAVLSASDEHFAGTNKSNQKCVKASETSARCQPNDDTSSSSQTEQYHTADTVLLPRRHDLLSEDVSAAGKTAPEYSPSSDLLPEGSAIYGLRPEGSETDVLKPESFEPSGLHPESSKSDELHRGDYKAEELHAESSDAKEPYPECSDAKESYPGSSDSREPYPECSDAKELYPESSDAKESYPGSFNANEPCPGSSNAREPYPESCNAKELYPERSDAKESYPERSDAKELYPERSDAKESYPERSDAKESYPERSDAKESYPERSDAKEPYPESSDAKESYPERSDAKESYPESFKAKELQEKSSSEAVSPSSPVTRQSHQVEGGQQKTTVSRSEDISFSVSEIDSNFTDAVSELMELVTARLDICNLKTGDQLVTTFQELTESFKAAEKIGDEACQTGHEACQCVIISGIFCRVEGELEKEMHEELYKDNQTTEALTRWRERKLAGVEDNLSCSRTLKYYKDSLISRNRSGMLKEKFSNMGNEFQFIDCGKQLQNLAKEVKKAGSAEKKVCNAKISEVYKQLQEHINHVCTLQGATASASIAQHKKSFYSALSAHIDLVWIEQFDRLFKDVTGVRQVKELQWDTSNDLASESDFKPRCVNGNSVCNGLQSAVCSYQPLPVNLVAEISKLCKEDSVEHAVLLQSHTDNAQAILIGQNASLIEEKLKRVQQKSPSFSLAVRDCQAPLLTTQYSWPVEQKVALSGKWLTSAKVTCGLLVTARQMNREIPSSDRVVYAVVPVHLILTQDQCVRTASAECPIAKTREEVESQTTNRRYVFEDKVSRKDLVHPPLIHYRHWYYTKGTAAGAAGAAGAEGQGAQQGKPSPLFMSDVALLQLPDFQPKQPDSVLNLFPIDKERTIELLVSRGQPVFVGEAEGRLTPCPRSIGSDEKSYGLHLAFVITSKDSNNKTMVLTPGDSGLTVYFKSKDDNLVPVGMFVGAFSESLPFSESQIYQAVVLTQVLKDIERDYPHQLCDIRAIETSR